MRPFIVCLVMSCLLVGCARESGVSASCPIVSSVHEIPFRDKPSDDKNYDRLRYDDSCEGTLLNSLTSVKPMKDPRQMSPDLRFVEADAALFLLLRRHHVDIAQLLPKKERPNWEDQGISAYFDYVASYQNRLRLIQRLDELLKSKDSHVSK